MNQREIKFRVWDKKENRMRFPKVLIYFEGELTVWRFWDETISLRQRPIPDEPERFEFMQYTGLKDKNGKGVYEGDVTKSGNGRIWEVKFSRFTFYIPDPGKEPIAVDSYGWYEEGNGNCLPLGMSGEVIGNIYENPNLLK